MPTIRPWGLQWRSSYWFVTLMVALGIATDLLVYSAIIPIMPFQLGKLGHKNVSALMGWLLFAYSGGLAISTVPVAIFSEKYNSRRNPMLFGIILLIGSQILLMETQIYSVMVIARVVQGFASTLTWVVALALLCESVPPQYIGRQLGIAMSGLTVGFLIGPPAAGALYSRFGYRGPFIFVVVAAVLDLIGRLCIIERKDALKWGHDPIAPPSQEADTNPEQAPETVHPPTLPFLAVLVRMGTSPRAMVSIGLSFIYGLVYSSQEPALPLHLAQVWNLNSAKVGLVYISSVVPTLVSGPLSGFYCDRFGPEWITVVCLLASMPWFGVAAIEGPLTLFIVSFALQSFFFSGIVTPIMTELAAISAAIEGVGYAHIYGAFNLAFGVGTSVGPILGGQIYEHVNVTRGWLAICLLATTLLAACVPGIAIYLGEDPLLKKLLRFRRRTSSAAEEKVMRFR
ncbi:major facilitator superfamily domain-containing protein [Mycena floridula]|nr:major facilitator superfamily domain-containing protein [Mycena floridula]